MTRPKYYHYKCRGKQLHQIIKLLNLVEEHDLNIKQLSLNPISNIDYEIEFRSLDLYEKWISFFIKLENEYEIDNAHIIYETFKTIDKYDGERQYIDIDLYI